MGKSSAAKQEVTEYYMSIHLGIATSMDSVNGIYVGEKLAWSGNVEVETAISINASELFGGPKKEGGVSGIAYYLPGGPDQVMPEALAARLGLTSETCPGYRGLSSLFFVGRDNYGSIAPPQGGGGEGGGDVGGGGGGGGVSGGGGNYCVVSESMMPCGKLAAQMTSADWLMVLDMNTLDRAVMAKCVRSVKLENDVDCVRVTTRRGVQLSMSATTPITLKDRSIVLVPDCLGAEIPTMVGNDFRWEPITAIEPIGKKQVAHIDGGGAVFAAGAAAGRWMFTHNYKNENVIQV